MLIGGPQARRNKAAWQQVYRSLDHGHARKKCQAIGSRGLAPKIRRFAAAFASLQAKRHLADYDPDETFYKSAVLTDIAIAEAAIHDLETAPLADKTAFAAWLLLKDRA